MKSYAVKYSAPQKQSLVKLLYKSWQLLYNEHDGVSKHRHLDCLLNRLSRCRSKKISKLCVTGYCEGNPPVTARFPSQRVSNVEKFPFEDVIMIGSHTWSINHKICIKWCYALFCFGYTILFDVFIWYIYPYSSGLVNGHWGTRKVAVVLVQWPCRMWIKLMIT